MKSEEFYYKARDGKKIFAVKWYDESVEKKGIVQLAHGMAEHIMRYKSFAKQLTQEGFIVYGNDHRGHGRTLEQGDTRGYFKSENGWYTVVEDMHYLTMKIKEENQKLPIYLMGHSMGSFLSRTYFSKYHENISGIIICGTGGNPGTLGKLGARIAKIEKRLRGEEKESKLLDKLSFGDFNKKFKPNRTKFDWLSRDESEVNKYVKDENCGGVFTSGFFYDLIKGIGELYTKEYFEKIPKELPVYIFSGDRDPVGNYGQDIIELNQLYKKHGVKDVEMKLYEGGRHEMLNEINKEEVYLDILNWLNKKVGSY